MKVKSIANVNVPVEVMIGDTELTAEEISGLGPGSIVKLDSLAGEPATMIAGGTVIARGEIVVIDEYFGIRVTEIVNGDE